jgi:hypothetical protein
MGAGVTGFQPTPDGIVRWAGMRRPWCHRLIL